MIFSDDYLNNIILQIENASKNKDFAKLEITHLIITGTLPKVMQEELI